MLAAFCVCLGVVVAALSLRFLFRRPRVSGAEKMRTVDSIWLQDSVDNLNIVTGVLIIARLPLEELRKVWLNAVQEKKFDRLKKMPVPKCDSWIYDDEFHIDRHVVLAREPIEKDWDGLKKMLNETLATQLPFDRPRWRVEVLNDFEKDSTVMVFRIHHSYADGAALVTFVESLFDDREEKDETPPSFFGKIRDKMIIKIGALLLFPLVMISYAMQSKDCSPLHGPILTGKKRVAWLKNDFKIADVGTLEVSRLIGHFFQVKRVKDAGKCTLNDVMCAVVAGALSRYFVGHCDRSTNAGLQKCCFCQC